VPRDQLFDEASDVRVHQRLAAGDRHHWRAAFVDGGEALLDRQVLPENLSRVLDLAAAGASQIAPEERLEHQHERVAFTAGQFCRTT